jgi:hyaluronoglucosaminidase
MANDWYPHGGCVVLLKIAATQCILLQATRHFEKAARDFMLLTLELLKQMRPSGQWGYYTFPYCFNYTPKNMQPSCPVQVQHENNE